MGPEPLGSTELPARRLEPRARALAWCIVLAACGSDPAPALPVPRTTTQATADTVPEGPPAESAGPDSEIAADDRYPADLFARPRTCEIPSPPPSGIEESLGVEYRRVDGAPLHLDVARPSSAGTRPLVVFVHGGGWEVGDREYHSTDIRVLAGLGYVAASIDYRLAPEHRFPAAASDVRCAVRYLSTRTDLGIDPGRIALAGFSAGGHLAALVGLAPADPSLDDVPCELDPAPVRAVVSYFGIYDLLRTDDLRSRTRTMLTTFLGPDASEARARLASPIHAVTPEGPAVLLVHGVEDPVIPFEHAVLMRDALLERRVPADLVAIDAGHGFLLRSPRPELRPALCATLAFLERALAPR
jgi:acetyl esterase/lipase